MSLMQVIVLHPYTKFEVRMVGFSVPKIWYIFRLSINRPGDLDL